MLSAPERVGAIGAVTVAVAVAVTIALVMVPVATEFIDETVFELLPLTMPVVGAITRDDGSTVLELVLALKYFLLKLITLVE